MKSLTKFNCVFNNNEVLTSREQDRFAGRGYLMNSLLFKCLVRAISALTNCTIKPLMQICKLVADAEEKSSSLGWFPREKSGTNEFFKLGVHTNGRTKVLPVCSTKFNLKLTGDSLIRNSGQLTNFALSMRCKLRRCLPELKRMMSGVRRRTRQSTGLSVYSLICATLLLIFQIESGMAQSTTVTISSDAGNMAGVGTGVTEGNRFKYKLERLPAMGPKRRNVMVAVTVTGTGHEKVRLYQQVWQGIPIAKDGTAFAVDLPLNSDYVGTIYVAGDVAATDAVKIKVELATTPTPTNYTVGSNSSITVNVKDSDNPSMSNPTLSVSGPSRKVRVDIGEQAVFKVTANYGSNATAPYPGKSLRFEVSQTNGDFLGSLDSFTMSGGALLQELSTDENVTEFSIPIEDSNTEQDDSDGSIRVRLLESEGYTLGNNTSSATIVDTPQGNILTINTEHDDANNKLTISVRGSEASSLDYRYYISHCIGLEVTGDTDIVLGTVSRGLHVGNFTSNIPNMGVYSVLTSVGASVSYNSARIVVDIDDDDGEITYRFLDARDPRINCLRADYQLASDQTYSAKFTEGPRKVTIETDAKDTGVTEGYSFDYTVRRTGSATSKVEVPVTVEVTPAGTTGITLTDAAGTAISTNQFNVEIPAGGRTSAPQTINVTGDVGADDDVKVNVSIPSAPTTYMLGTDSSVSVKVKDNDSASTTKPIITIAPHEDNPVFTDVGSSAKFRVTAAPDRSNEDGIIRVNYTISQSGDILHRDSQSPTGYVNIAEGETTAVIRIYTKSDDPNAGDGSISVTVVEGVGYTLSNNSDDATAMVTVKVPLPKISISSPGTEFGVSERASFELTLTRAGNTTIPLEVFVSVSISGEESANVAFSGLRPTSFTFPIGASTITRTLSLSSTSNVRRAGTFVNVELRKSTTLTYVLDWDRMTSLSVPVNDIDILKMAISGPSSIVEGDVASFTITAFDFAGTVSTGKAISVNYRVINLTGDFLAVGEARVDEVTIAEGASSVQFNVSTVVKNPNGTDGSFAVELRDGMDYVVSDVLSEKRVAVSVANPALPYVRVLDNSVMEGDSGSTSISFNVSLSEPMDTEFSLDWAVSSGISSFVDYIDFVGGTADGPLPNGTVSFEFAEGETATVKMTSFTLEVQGDGLVEPDENFTVTLSNPTANDTSYAGIVIVDPTATGTIENDDHPVISLSTDVSSVAEGSTFDVTLTAVPTPVNGYAIEITTLSLDSTGNTGTIPATPISIDTSGTATVTVTITDDDYFSDGGTLTVQLADGTSYTADTEQNIASVAVTDNEDFPVVALTSSRIYLTEGKSFSVTLETLQTIGGGYELMVSTLFVDSSGFAGTISPSVIAIGSSGIATAIVTATDDSVTANGGNLTVTLQNGTNYTADAANNSVVVRVSDNDVRVDRRVYGGDFTISLAYDSSTPHGFLPQSGKFSFHTRFSNPFGFDYWESFSGSPEIDYDITPRLTPRLTSLYMRSIHLYGDFFYTNELRDVPTGTANVEIDATRTVSDLDYVTDSSADTYTTNPLTIYRSTPDKPGVIITRNSESISENEDAEFTVEAVTAPATGNDTVVTVNLSHGMNEDFLDSTQSLNPTVTLTNASPSQTLTVKLDDDSEYEPDGTITAVLAAGGAEYVVSPVTGSATMAVKNNDFNHYEISIESDFVNVIAGAEFGFEVSAKPSMTDAVTEDLTVMLDISDGDAGFLNAFPTQLIIPKGKTSATGAVSTNALETLTGTPTITVALATSGAANQTTNTTHGSLAIPIVAIESLPTILMHGPAEPVTEGDAIQFNIELSAKQSADTSLRVFVDEVNDQGTAADGSSFLVAPVVNKLIRIPGGHRTVAFTVPTVDDAIDEVEGAVKAQVVLGAGYQGSAEAFADVLDNDGLVRLQLSAPETVAENAGSFNATITARRSPGSFPLAFTLVRSGGNFLQDAEAAKTATDAAVTFDGPNNDGEYTYELAVNLDNDVVKEPTGSVTVTLTATSNYRVIESAASKIVTVYDDDAPELLIRGLGDVTEGDPGDPVAATADFSVTARVMPNQGKSNAGMLQVYYNRVSANHLVRGAVADASSDLTFSDASGNGSGPFTATLSETIAGNTTAGDDGTYVVTLSPEPLPGSNYHVVDTASGKHTATVNVIDDDPNFELSMSTPVAVAESDGSFHATITANRDPGPIVLAYSLEKTVGNFLTDAEAAKTGTESPVAFNGPNSDGDYTFDLEVRLHNDDAKEMTGAVTLNLTSTSNYTADATTATKRVTVYDDDAPELLIRGLGDVVEGNPDDAQIVTADFAVEARVMPNLGDADEGMLRVRFNQSSSTYLATGSSADAVEDLMFTDSSGDGTGPFIAQLMLPIASNTTADGDGTYVVALVPESPAGTTYHVVDPATGDHTATVNVIDDESLPTVTVTGPATGTLENAGVVAFSIVLNVMPTEDLVVAYMPTNVGSADFLAHSYPSEAEVAAGTAAYPTATLAQTDFQADGTGNYSATLNVQLEDDAVGEHSGEIMLALKQVSAEIGRFKLGTQFSANATVWDDDAPELLLAGPDQVREGRSDQIAFTVTARLRPASGMLNVHFTASETDALRFGDYLDASKLESPQQIVFATGERTALLTVPILDDDEWEFNDRITVTLIDEPNPATTYTVSRSNSAVVKVVDNDEATIPFLSIEPVNAEVTESGTADFIVSGTLTNIANSIDILTYRYRISQVGDFIDNSSGNFTVGEVMTGTIDFSGGRFGVIYSQTLSIDLADDAAPEVTGSVVVTLMDSELDMNIANYNNSSYNIVSKKHRASVTVYDTEAPELAISVLPENVNVIEGDQGDAITANFTLTARVSPDENISVRYRATEESLGTGDFLAAGEDGVEQTISLNFSGDGTIATLPVSIVSDGEREDNSTITVELLPEAMLTTYSVDADNSSAGVKVIDNDSPAQLSIIGPSDEIAENEGPVIFKVRSTRPITATVNFETENVSGNFLATTGGKNVELTFELDLATAEFVDDLQIAIDDDGEADRTGMIKVTLMAPDANASDAYEIDAASQTHPTIATATILDDDAPELSISADSNVIFEGVGAMASFTIATKVKPKTDLAVIYRPSSLNFLAAGQSDSSATANPPLEFSETEAGSGLFTATLNVAVHDDAEPESDGRITVTLIDENPVATYTVDSDSNSATVAVRDDDDLATLSISGPLSAVESDEFITFLVTADANSNPGLNRPVVVRVTGSSLDYTSPYFNYVANLDFKDYNGVFAANLVVSLNNDPYGQSTGTIAAMLNELTGNSVWYRLSVDNRKHTVTLYDDDAPEIWISAATPDVIESDGEAIFTIMSRVKPSTNPFSVRYRPESSSFLTATDSGSEQVSAPLMFTPQSADENGSYVATLTVKLDVDTVADLSGPLTVTLLKDRYPPKYMLNNSADTPVTASAFVFDTQGTPTATLFRLADSIVEGQPAEFRVRIFPLAQRSLRVNLNVSQVGDFLFRGPKYVVVPPEGTTTLSIGTDDDLMDELAGSLTVVVVAGDGYEAGPSLNNTVRITDNDEQGSSGARYSVAAAVIADILLQIPETPAGSAAQLGAAGPVVAIAAVSQSILEGRTAVFEISAAPVPTESTAVHINLAEVGDFISGSHAVSVVLNAGETTEELRVATEDDAISEPDGSIIARIAKGVGYRISGDSSLSSATVAVSDEQDRIRQHQLEQAAIRRINAANLDVLPVLAGSMGARLQDATATRMQQAFAESTASEFNLNGLSSIQDMVKTGGEAVNDGMKPWQEMLGNSSFTLDLYPEAGISSSATIWGLGDYRSVADSASAAAQLRDSSMFTGHIGMDARISRELVAGVIASVADSDIGYGSASDSDLLYDSQSTGLHPYLGYQSLVGKTRLLFSFGFGTSETGIESDVLGRQTLNSSFYTKVANGSTQFYSAENILGGSSGLSLAGESWLTGHSTEANESGLDAMNFNASHYALSIVGTHNMKIASTSSFAPELSVGIRGDRKGQEDFTGLELAVGGVLSSWSTGLSVGGDGLLLLSHGDRIRERSLQGEVAYDHGNDGLGLQLNVTPVWGQADTAVDSGLWARSILEYDEESAPYIDGAKLNSKVAYGFKMLEGVWTVNPYTEFEMTEGKLNSLQVGNRITVNQQMDFELEGSENIETGGVANRAINFTGTIKW